MTGHPLVLAIWLLDLTAGAIYLAAGLALAGDFAPLAAGKE